MMELTQKQLDSIAYEFWRLRHICMHIDMVQAVNDRTNKPIPRKVFDQLAGHIEGAWDRVKEVIQP